MRDDAGIAQRRTFDRVLAGECRTEQQHSCFGEFQAGIQTVGELVRKSESELNAIPNFGRKSIEEVQETLRARGLGLRAE